MKVLVITDVLWRNDNGVGNSYSNIFSNMQDVEFANICCACGKSQNNISTRCFQISERSIVSNLIRNTNPSGIEEDLSKKNVTEDTKPSKRRIPRLQIFFWIRNLIWLIGKWKSKELDNFIDDFNPDIIFAQIQDKMYQNELVLYVQKKTKKPLVLYAWDDIYSMKQFSLSPLYWIDRLFQRKSIRKLVQKCSILYTICIEQMKEYNSTLNAPTKLLYKGKVFKDEPEFCIKGNKIKILYTGNLYSGRCKTIIQLCDYIKEINKHGERIVIEIYSGTPLSKNEKIALGSCFKGSISESEVQQLQKTADVLLHIEPFSLRGSLMCRLSFSTKLVDYFHKKKCIFAVGSRRCASMKYLKRNNAAIVSNNIDEMKKNIDKLLNDDKILDTYAQNAWMCGKNNHSINSIQQGLLNDFNQLIEQQKDIKDISEKLVKGQLQ